MARNLHEKLNQDRYFYYSGSSSQPLALLGKYNETWHTLDHVNDGPWVTTKDDYGWRQPMPYSAEVYSVTGPVGQWFSQYGSETKLHSGNLRSVGYVPDRTATLPSAGLRSLAEVDALLKLKDQKVNLGQAFAERAQTVNLFTSNIEKIGKSIRALRKGRWKDAARHLGVNGWKPASSTAFSRWLELQYGWKPLLGDIYGSCEALAEIPLHRYIVTVKSKKAVGSERYVSEGGGRYYAPIMTHETELQQVLVRLDYHPTGVLLREFSSLGVTNPFELAWELMPWSFVIDWALPIGDWLSTLDAANGYEFIGGSYTMTGRKQHRYSSHSVDRDRSRSIGVVGGARSVITRRTTYPYSPIPTLPRLENPWSSGTRVANAMALLGSALSGADRRGLGRHTD